MARPTSKKDLLTASEENFTKLFELVDAFDEKAKKAEYIFDNNRDKNIRDILAHLYHWHTMVLEWYKVGMKGEKPDIPAKGYNWRTTPALNREIWKMYQETSFEESVVLLKKSHKKMMTVIKSHNNDELFEKKRFKWTGNNAMGAYFASATSSHYDWAMKHLKRYKRTLKGQEMKKVQIKSKTITGLKVRTKNEDEMNPDTQKIAALWGRFFHEILPTLEEDATVYAVYSNYELDANAEYDITVGADKIATTDEMEEIVIKEDKYLRFEVKGEFPQALLDTWGKIWAYFESKDCKEKRAYNTDFEKYVSKDEADIYIGIM